MEVYHGSNILNLKIIKPNPSTHGNYVYATNDKTIAIVMSHAIGSDLTYSFGRDSKDKPYDLVERLPGAFKLMYKNKASIYTLDDTNFKDIKTGFNEVVSIKEEKVIKEEKIDNLINELEKLEKENLIKIYKYPNKPDGFKKDNSDLIDKIALEKDKDVMIRKYAALLSYYPELLEKVNNKLFKLDNSYDGFDKKSLFVIMENCIDRYNISPDKEPFLMVKLNKFRKSYPIYFKNIDLVKILKSKSK